MDNLTDIFDSETQDSSEDLDVDLANAGMLLHKLAAEEGVDLSALSDADVADLLTDLLPGENAANYGEPQQKEASAMDQNDVPEQLTYADVAVELAKVASSNGIDLNEVSREEYHDAFTALSERMQDPSYFSEKVAAEEKLAEAEAIGQRMALSFIETLKEAKGDEPPGIFESSANYGRALREHKGVQGTLGGISGAGLGGLGGAALGKAMGVRHGVPVGAVLGALAGGAGGGALGYHVAKGERAARERLNKTSGMSDTVRRGYHATEAAVRRGASTADSGVQSLGEKALKLVGGEGAAKASPALKRGVGGAIGATGLAAAGGATYAAKKHMDKKSEEEAFEADAMDLARGILAENGIDPDTGKVATYEDVVAERAMEILKEAGYLE